MKKPTIGACLIVKPSNDEAKYLKKALKNIRPFVDEIFLTITGENSKCADVGKQFSARISYMDWDDDFAAARNFNFGMADTDWIIWMDADDTFRGLDNLKDMVDEAEQYAIKGVFLPYEYQHDANGNVIEEHYKLQMIKNDKTFEWKGAIHEDLLQQKQAQLAKEQRIVRVHGSTHERSAESFVRNARILQKELEKQGDAPDPRTLFYLGQTYIALKQYNEGITLLDEYLKLSGWDDERYRAYLLVGEAYVNQEKWDLALKVYNNAILEKETFPDAYFSKATCYIQKGQHKNAIMNLLLGLDMPVPKTNIVYNPFNYTKIPLQQLAYCFLETGDIDKAHESIQKALSYDKNDENSLALLQAIQFVKEKRDIGKSIATVCQFLEKNKQEDKILQLLSGTPNELLDSPYVLKYLYKYNEPMEWGDNTIAIYCSNTAEDWSPKSLDRGGIGGSETAVVKLSQELTKRGWNVTVYNQCGIEDGVYDGVEYKPNWTFNPKDKFNVLISWRNPRLFMADIDAKLKCVDMHDVMTPSEFSDVIHKIDLVFVKSEYHKTLYLDVPDEKFVVISNGIDLDRFKGKEARQPKRCIYSSTPNRGLDIILDNWEKILEKHPDAELYVYYGWKTFFELEKNNPAQMKWMKEVQKKMKQKGIIDCGRVGQKELAQEMLKSDVWLYPTYFEEINCITALEDQASGVIPIVTNFAALKETVSDDAYKIEGDIHNPKIQEKWVNTVIEVLDDKDRESLRPKLQKFASRYGWDTIADEWDKTLKERTCEE